MLIAGLVILKLCFSAWEGFTEWKSLDLKEAVERKILVNSRYLYFLNAPLMFVDLGSMEKSGIYFYLFVFEFSKFDSFLGDFVFISFKTNTRKYSIFPYTFPYFFPAPNQFLSAVSPSFNDCDHYQFSYIEVHQPVSCQIIQVCNSQLC